MDQTDPLTAPSGTELLRRNWAGWYPDGDDLIFEQTGYDLRTPALSGLVGFVASLAVLVGLVTLGLPGEPLRNGVYGALLVVAIIALVACATVARQTFKPIHRVARFSRAEQGLIVRDVLALGVKRVRRYAYAELGEAQTRSERALTRPRHDHPDVAHDYLLAYPVMHIELQRNGQRRGLTPLTLTTGALLSPYAAQRGADAINAHLEVARAPREIAPPPVPVQPTPAVSATPTPTTQAAASDTPLPTTALQTGPTRRTRRPIPPRPLR